MATNKLRDLSNEELVSRLHAICRRARHTDVQLIAHLIEVEARGLHLVAACTSLYDFCVRRLGMSGTASSRRIVVARLAKRFPSLLRHLRSGKVHLSHVAALRDHLTEANVEELVGAVSGKTMQDVEVLLATRFPQPDVPAGIVDLPASGPGMLPGRGGRFGRLKPLSESRCLLQVSISVEIREKLERSRDLMRHRNPMGDLEALLEEAFDTLLAKVEKERQGTVVRPRAERRQEAQHAAQPQAAQAAQVQPVATQTSTPRPGPGPGPAKARHISREVRREVYVRDGAQCAFVDGDDRRCPSRAFLEIDHIQSHALGGSDDASNLRLLCRAHNRLHAEQVFGKAHIAEQIHNRQRLWTSLDEAAWDDAPDVSYDAGEAAHYARRSAEGWHDVAGGGRGAPS